VTYSTARDASARLESPSRRSLKILHVGNVAQNAYINASILRARGHDCDVLAFDWYHPASSPEWYELAFSDVGAASLGDDPYFPDFYALGRDMPLVGDWVAHGPCLNALQYLLLKRRGNARAHAALSTLAYLRFKATQQRTLAPMLTPMSEDAFRNRLAHYDLDPTLRRRILLGRTADRYYDWVRSRVSNLAGSQYIYNWHAPLTVGTLDQFFPSDPVLAGVMGGLRARGLAEAFGIEFRGPRLDFTHLETLGFTSAEVTGYGTVAPLLHDLASHYDLCIFYGETCKLALAAGIPRYWALEHGSIRNAPFEPTTEGRLLAAAFAGAEKVFLTNTDYATAEQRLEFAAHQRVYAPHPFDEAPAFAFRRIYPGRRDPDGTVFFCPARHEWRSCLLDPHLSKGNDRYLRAARLLLDRGWNAFTLHLVDWGADCKASRALIAELGLERHVRWSPLMSKRKLWAAKLDAHAVIDQFGLSALGGVGFEALALGVRLISRDDGVNNATFFGEPPPIMAASTPHEIAARMEAVMHDPEDAAGIGEKGMDWVSLHHSADRIHDLQIAALSDRSPSLSTSRRTRADPISAS